MTEAEWKASRDPVPMLRWLGRDASEQQLRQFGVACCRRIWMLFNDERSRRAVEAVEGYLAGEVTEEQMSAACDDAEWPYQDANLRADDPENANPEPDRVAEDEAYAAHMVSWPKLDVGFAIEVATGAAAAASGRQLPNEESTVQAELLRRLIPYPTAGDGVGHASQAGPGAAPDRRGE